MRRADFKRKSRVIVVDDNYDHASGIRELINLEQDYEVIANAGNVINMPEIDGITAISEIEKLGLKTKIIALTGYDDADLIYRAMKIGAKGYILKTMASAQLIRALDEVTMGKIYLPSVLCSKFFEYFQAAERNEKAYNAAEDEENLLNYLTNREEEVLGLLTEGITYKGVAQQLFISETTVKTHVNNIFQKLQVNDRTQAVLYAINKGFGSRKKAKIA